MNTEQAYNIWAEQYDTNKNRTRDLEAISLRKTLTGKRFSAVLEVGCGTGKNTTWLQSVAESVLAIDLSDEMLAKAKAKVVEDHVQFRKVDIQDNWSFADTKFDLITFSLVLEHIEELGPIMFKASEVLAPGGLIYVGELHPFKQYAGTKARFETEQGVQVVPCFNHHISDFLRSAFENNLALEGFEEFFDEEDRSGVPRILTLLFRNRV